MPEISQYSPAEEQANTLSHALGTILSIVGAFWLLVLAIEQHDLLRIVSFTVYGISLVLLFSASTLYHGLKTLKAKKLFKLLDHCAIYLLIAGSYTPLMLLTIQGTLGYAMLVFIWLIALAGIIFKIKFGHKYKKTSLAIYLGMGFISVIIINELLQKLPTGGLVLLATGGLIYTLGVFFYVKKSIPFNHAIWHLFVLAGAGCHFFMIRYYI